MRFIKSGIKRSVLIIAIIPVAIVSVILSVVFSINQTRSLQQSLIDRGYSIVRQLGPASEYGVFSGNAVILQPLVDALMAEVDVNAVIIRTVSGKVLIKRGDTQKMDIETPFPLRSPKTTNTSNSIVFHAPIFQTEYPTDDLLYDFTTLQDTSTAEPAEPVVLGQVSVELSLSRTKSNQMQSWLRNSLIALAVMLLSGLLAIRIGRRITNPILDLTSTVQQLENGDLRVRVNTSSEGELGSLEKGVNAMADSLETTHNELEDRVEKATAELIQALQTLEQRNIELDTARRDAESANRAKSSFLANTSHEIRTPLHGISGFLMLLEKTELDETQRDYLGKIASSTKNLSTLLNDVLDFSRLEVLQPDMSKQDFRLRQLIDDCVCNFLPDAQRKAIELALIVDAELPEYLTGAADRIAQVIKNLVSNAIKFTQQGEVVVRAELSRDPQGEHNLKLSVTDTGIGISASDKDRLFKPFSQLETGKTRSFGGTGLGLAISRSLVELMDGRISVDSIPGRGSCFSILLPIHTRSPTPSELAQIEPLKNRQILIVSTDSNTRLCLEQLLLHWQAGVVTTDSLQRIPQQDSTALRPVADFDIVIIDNLCITDDQQLLATDTRNFFEAGCRVILLVQSDTPIAAEIAPLVDARLRYPATSYDLCTTIRELIASEAGPVTGAPPPPAQTQHPRFHGYRILLADDNAINRQFLSTWLKQAGVKVDEVKDGEEAVERCRLRHYDLILMDLHMPRLDGVEAASKINAPDSPAANTPIIAITADASEQARNELEQSSIVDLLLKPVNEQGLLRMISKYTSMRVSDAPEGFDQQARTGVQLDHNLIVDHEAGLRLASGNQALWRWSLQTLDERLPSHLSALRTAFDLKQTDQLRTLAHEISGSASYCGANQLADRARQLERAGTTTGNPDLSEAYQSLIEAIDRFHTWAAQNPLQH